MSETEFGKCDICGEEKPLQRTYYHYDIKCNCHSPNHFEIVSHCKDCTPKEPLETKVYLSPIKKVEYKGGDAN